MYKDIMFGVGQVIYIMIKVYFLLTQEIQTVPDAQIPSYLSCANIEKKGLFCITKEWSNTSDTIFCFYVLTTDFFFKGLRYFGKMCDDCCLFHIEFLISRFNLDSLTDCFSGCQLPPLPLKKVFWSWGLLIFIIYDYIDLVNYNVQWISIWK